MCNIFNTKNCLQKTMVSNKIVKLVFFILSVTLLRISRSKVKVIEIAISRKSGPNSHPSKTFTSIWLSLLEIFHVCIKNTLEWSHVYSNQQSLIFAPLLRGLDSRLIDDLAGYQTSSYLSNGISNLDKLAVSQHVGKRFGFNWLFCQNQWLCRVGFWCPIRF